MSVTHTLIQRHKSRGIKTWYIRTFQDGKESYRSTGTAVKAEALRIFADFIKASEASPSPRDAKDISVIAELDRWVEIQKNRFGEDSNTYHLYLGNAKKLREFLVARRISTVQQVTKVTAQDFVNGMMADGLKPSSVEIVMRCVKFFYRWLLDTYDLNVRNPFAGIALPKVENRLAEFWTAEECDRIVDHASNRYWAAFFGLQCYAGLRYFEACKIRIEDFKDGTLHIVQDKTKKDTYLPISDKLKALLEAARDGRDEGSLFVGKIGLHHATALKYIKMAVKAAGLEGEGRAFLHRLRHSFASNLLRGGVNIKSVQVLGRWSSSNILLKHYAGVIPADLTDAGNRL